MIGCSKSDSVLIGSLPLYSQSENDPSKFIFSRNSAKFFSRNFLPKLREKYFAKISRKFHEKFREFRHYNFAKTKINFQTKFRENTKTKISWKHQFQQRCDKLYFVWFLYCSLSLSINIYIYQFRITQKQYLQINVKHCIELFIYVLNVFIFILLKKEVMIVQQ